MSALAARRTHTDVLFGLLLAVWGQLELWWSGFVFTVDPNRRPMWLLTLCQLGMTAPVAIRRRVPLTALSIAMGALAVEQLATAPADTVASLVGLLVLTGTAAARCGGGGGGEAGAGPPRGALWGARGAGRRDAVPGGSPRRRGDRRAGCPKRHPARRRPGDEGRPV